MYEPRGHAAMSGAILQPPTRPDADWGVLFIEVSGCLPMCGHGTIGVATVLVETGMVEVTEPVTPVRLDTPAGLVVAEVAVEDGVAAQRQPRSTCPPSPSASTRSVTVEGLGPVTYDLAFGGNFYAILDLEQVGLPFDRAHKNEILTAGLAMMAAINEHNEPVHPENPDIRGCHHVQFLAPGADARTPGTPWRSTPAGSTARRAAPAPRPGWPSCTPAASSRSAPSFINESFIGSRFTGRIVEETRVAGVPAVIPRITGRAWITGTAQYVLDPDDPFPEGFQL